MKLLLSISLALTLGCLVTEAYPQKKDLEKNELDKKVREGKGDLLQGCTAEQLVLLDQENIACYKRVIILEFTNYKICPRFVILKT